jgi:UTP--glucose-1-phosphate uridylyltransferase
MRMKCERAIIAVGGIGSRMLPWAYANEKCQVPLSQNVIDAKTGKTKKILRPLIDFVVEDCLKAGIHDITLIVGENAVNTRRLYEGNPSVDEFFKSRGKEHLLKNIRSVSERATFTVVEQPYGDDAPYGTTCPVALARDVINQPGQTLIIMGDQLFYRTDGGSEAQNLLDSTERAGVTAGMLAMPVDPAIIDHYGIAIRRPDGFLDHMREKPAVGSTAENDANASIYVVDQRIVPFIDNNMQRLPQGVSEHMFTDVMNEYAKATAVAVVLAIGTYLDCGKPDTYEAARDFMRDQPPV